VKAMDLEELPEEWKLFIFNELEKELEKKKKKKRRK
jgi:hypothetical protein